MGCIWITEGDIRKDFLLEGLLPLRFVGRGGDLEQDTAIIIRIPGHETRKIHEFFQIAAYYNRFFNSLYEKEQQ